MAMAAHPNAVTSADPTTRVPQLASASSTAGQVYSLWRPQIQTHMMRQNIEERDYTRPIPRWRELVAAVQTDATAADDIAMERVLAAADAAAGKSAGAMPTSSSSTQMKQELPSTEELAAKKAVAALIGRSQKAFGFLYAALPADLRLLVADVPQGYAYGVWSFLEKKYRNTEQDNVAALWKQFVTLTQTTEETFDEYKARVDSVVELLKHAKASLDAGLYSTILMWNLQPRYATAVLTLKTGDRLKDPAKVDWPAIAEYMAQYERSQEHLGETGEGERAFVARGWPQSSSASSVSSSDPGGRGVPAWVKSAQCYNCDKKGHLSKYCPEPRRPRRQRPEGKKPRKGANKKSNGSWSHGGNASGSSGAESESDSEPKVKKTNMALQVNRYAVLQEVENDEETEPTRPWSGNRSYLARVMNATSASASRPSSAAAAASSASSSSAKEKEKPASAAASAAASAQPVRKEPKVLRPLDDLLKTTAKAVDSAATVSTSCKREYLEGVQRCKPVLIKMADGTVLSAMYKGTLSLRLPVADDVHGRFVVTKIPDVYYHERFDANLLSWGLMRKNGWEMHSTQSGTYLVTPGGKKVKASTRGGLTTLEDHIEERVYKLGTVVCMTAKEVVAHHYRLGHVSWTRLLQMCKAGSTAGIGDIRNMPAAELAKAEEAVRRCTACAEAKAHKKPLGHRGLDKGTEAGAVLHVDTASIVVRDPTTGEKNRRPVLSVKDSFTEHWWVEVCLRMADVQQAVIDVLQHSHTLTGRYPRLVVSDLGSEFDNKKVKGFCREHGIQLQYSPARSKEMNGVAEKGMDTLKNHTRAMLYAAKAPERLYWRFALTHFAYVWNRTHVGHRTGTTPYQAMTGREASVLNLAEFGCDAYVHQHRSTRDETFSRKALPAVYLGHDARTNSPMALILRSGKIVSSRDVHFREGSFKHLRALCQDRGDEVAAQVDDGADDLQDEPQTNGFDAAAAEVLEESEEDAVTEKRYVLRSITDSRVQDGVKQYRVKWSGYSGATWEPAALIKQDAPQAVKDYESLVSDRAAARSSVTTRSQARAGTASSSSSAAAPVSDSDTEDDQSEVSMAAADAARRL
jgi:hypothetical protein